MRMFDIYIEYLFISNDCNMEIINNNLAVLSNFEVANVLRNMKSVKKHPGLRNLATITYETLQYLDSTAAKDQKSDNILCFLRAVGAYNLAKNECLMMVNDPPTSALHIHLLVEDSEERLSEEQVNEIIELSKTYLLMGSSVSDTTS